jgi:hypothetical protein
MRVPFARLNAVAILLSVALFLALEAAAMRLYPGGTWWDSHAVGHRFWENFLCDLEWRVALDGSPNPIGSRLAFAAMATLAAGVGFFWFAVACILAASGRDRIARFVRIAGVASVLGILVVISMPSDAFGALHGVVVICASLLGFAATTLAILGLRLAGRRALAALGGATMAAAVLDFGLYASHFAAHTQDSVLTPAVEKVALGALLAWMVAVARSVAS